MAVVAVGRHAQGAAFHGIEHQALHLLHFRAGGLALHRFFAHGMMAHGDMTDQAADVDADLAFEVVEILAVAMPVPFDALFERDARDRFDAHEAFDDGVFDTLPDRRQGQPAVAHHHRGHAVLRLAGAVGVPKHLRVEMGMMVDESRRNREAAGIDSFGRSLFDLADFGNLAVLNPDIGNIRRQARPIDHAPTANN